jgi:cytochrome b subunit of formate dehydrogenase
MIPLDAPQLFIASFVFAMAAVAAGIAIATSGWAHGARAAGQVEVVGERLLVHAHTANGTGAGKGTESLDLGTIEAGWVEHL